MKKISKKMISIFLSICILLSIIPFTTEAKDDSLNRYTVIVLDTSASAEFYSSGNPIYTADTAIDYVKRASKKFLSNIAEANGKNYVAVVSYKESATVVSDFSQDTEGLRKKIDGLSASGNIRSIGNGLSEAKTLLDKISDKDAIKNVVLFTTGMTNGGSYNYTGIYDSNTVGSSWYRIDTGINLYAYANVACSVAQQIKDSGASVYSIGLFQTMDNMPEQGKTVVEFFKLTAFDLASGWNYFYSAENPDDLEFVFGNVADDVISGTKKTGEFFYASGSEEDFKAEYFYDDNYFSKSAYEYQDSLATMSMCLAFSAFGSNRVPNTAEGYEEKSQNLKYLLSECGFSEEYFETNEGYKKKPGTDTIGVGASYKKITINGEEYTLIGAAVRGGGYESEWASNFTIGTSGLHQGFENARDQVISFLEDYVENQGITGKVKLWITGYSRAAATTNLVAGKLDSGYSLSEQIELENRDIYAYCFEAPKGGLITDNIKDSLYDNIHSIINPADVVTKVAPTTPKEFGFDRYGSTKFLPTALNKASKDYESAKKEMLKKYNALDSTEKYIVDDFQMKKISVPNLIWDVTGFLEEGIVVNNTDKKWDQNAFLDEMLEKLFSENVKNRPNYVKTYQDDIREICEVVFGTPKTEWGNFYEKFMEELNERKLKIAWHLMTVDVIPGVIDTGLVKAIEDAAVEALNDLGITEYSRTEINLLATKIASLLISFGVKHPNLAITAVSNYESIGAAHYPELCLAWLQSFDKNYTREGREAFSDGIYRVIHVNCPVDVEVYDAEGNLVAAIADDKAKEVKGSSIVSFVNDAGEKLIYLPAESEYYVEMLATDDGHLTYSVNEYSEEVGGTNRIVNYLDVEISENDILTGEVPEIAEEEMIPGNISGSTVQYTLWDDNYNEIPADDNLSGEEALNAKHVVTVTSANEEQGGVVGSDIVKTGNYAKVVAIPNSGYCLEGWYVGDTLVSTEYEYRFCVEKDVELTAVFEEADVMRISGKTRYETAYQTANTLKKKLGLDKFEAVVVATGKNFADALAGSYLAVEKNAPIILTNGKEDNIAQLHAYIAENVVAGGKVYILGGEDAVPAEAAAMDGYEVERLSGKSRYETNLAILAEAGVAGDFIIVATGKTFADSLSASAAKLPILLVKPGETLSEEAKAIVKDMKNIYIIGGEDAVSAEIAEELAAFGTVTRVSGKSRYETSVAVAETFFGSVENAVVASGKNFPDGLCGGPLAVAMNAPLILTADGKTAAAVDYVKGNAVVGGYVLGGTAALSDDTVVDVFELVSAGKIGAN